MMASIGSVIEALMGPGISAVLRRSISSSADLSLNVRPCGMLPGADFDVMSWYNNRNNRGWKSRRVKRRARGVS